MPHHQTPPVVPVSPDQIGKWVEITQARIRKGNLDLPTFQYILGHPDLVPQLDKMFGGMAAEYRQRIPLLERPPFATIQIGTFKKVKQICQALADKKFRVSGYASDLMDRMALVTEPMTIDLYRATNAELGLTQGGTVAQSFEAIAKIGGEKLPAEVGPYWRLNNPDQPMGQWELMYMDPVTDRDGYPGVFNVVHDEDGLWLYGYYARPESSCSAEYVWVFGRKRPGA